MAERIARTGDDPRQPADASARSPADVPASLRPGGSDDLKSGITRPWDDQASPAMPGRGGQADSRAGENDKPGIVERAVTAVKDKAGPVLATGAAAVIMVFPAWAADGQPRHDSAEGGRDRTELTAKDGHGTAADKTDANATESPAGESLVAEVNAPIRTHNSDELAGAGLEAGEMSISTSS
jgi:hypothetical protein